MTRIVTEAELRTVIGYDRDALRRVQEGYVWLNERRVSMPPVFHIDIDPQSAVDVKGAFVEGQDAFAIKMASGFFANTENGLPSSSSVILLISSQTGFCQAVMLDNGYLMNLRTALAGAVAADHLARQDVRTVGIVGTGVQAREQLRALLLVRDVQQVFLWGRTAERTDDCAEDLRAFTNAPVSVCRTLKELTENSEIIVTTTQASEPLIKSDWVQPGTHITAMGSDLPGKHELSPSLLHRSGLVVCDSVAQCEIGGELQHVAPDDLKAPPVSLSDVVCGTHPGRADNQQITICDMTGLGVLDTAIALAAFDRLG